MRILRLLSILMLAAFAGCQTVSEVGTAIGVATGTISEDQAESIVRTSTAVGRTFEDITPEQEYYIGRAVGATVLAKYEPYDEKRANEYINTLGQALALASDKPETFGGYRFLIIDSDEINAFAAPGGLIFISRGMLRLCRTEDDVAAVLAHEIGHVQHAHGLRAIKSGRLSSAFAILAIESARQLGGSELRDLVNAFDGSIEDISTTMMNSGYSRRLEREADVACVTILKRVGYDPNSLVRVLDEMAKQLKPGGLDFAKTHPDPNDRIKDIRRLIGATSVTPAPATRQKRFEKALSGV